MGVETRNAASTITMQGVPKFQFHNLGGHHKWKGPWTKVHLYLNWLRNNAAQAPDQMIILSDSSDVSFGGCSTDDLIDRYNSIVQACQGAPVLVGGDFHLWPPPLVRNRSAVEASFATLDSRRTAVLQQFAMTPDAYGTTYKYVNSGFMMGPASDLLNVVSCMMDKGKGGTRFGQGPYGISDQYPDPWFDDQYGLTMCLLDESVTGVPQIALDYSGSVVLDMDGLDPAVLYGSGGVVFNRATLKRQCFIHGNGKSFPPSKVNGLLRAGTNR